MTYISWSSDFALYLESYLTYEHHTLGLMSQYDPMFDLKINVGHWCTDFALYLENYSVAEHHTLGLSVSMT